MKPLINAVDRKGEALDSIPQSDSVAIATTIAATNTAITIPTDAFYAVFQNLTPDEPIFAKFDLTANPFAGVPADGEGLNVMVNPDVRTIPREFIGQSVHLVTTNAARVVINFYGY